MLQGCHRIKKMMNRVFGIGETKLSVRRKVMLLGFLDEDLLPAIQRISKALILARIKASGAN